MIGERLLPGRRAKGARLLNWEPAARVTAGAPSVARVYIYDSGRAPISALFIHCRQPRSSIPPPRRCSVLPGCEPGDGTEAAAVISLMDMLRPRRSGPLGNLLPRFPSTPGRAP